LRLRFLKSVKFTLRSWVGQSKGVFPFNSFDNPVFMRFNLEKNVVN
jgi:hypothetical protein